MCAGPGPVDRRAGDERVELPHPGLDLGQLRHSSDGSAYAAVGSGTASSIGSGISRRWRCGEKTIQSAARLPPIALTTSVSRSPTHVPRSPARERPDGDRAPHDEAHHRVHAPLQPRRADRLPVADLDDVVGDAREAQHQHAGHEERHRRVAGRGEGEEQRSRAPEPEAAIVVGPIPNRLEIRVAVRAASSEPAAPIERTRPMSPGESSSSRTAKTRRTAKPRLPNMFDVAVHPA